MKNSLAEYVRKVMDNDRLSGYAIERRSKGEITQSYVLRIKNGTANNVSVDRLKSLSKGLGRPLTELVSAAFGFNISMDIDSTLSQLQLLYEDVPPGRKYEADYLLGIVEREMKLLKDPN